MKKVYLFIILIFLCFSCNKIETQETLNQSDIQRIENFGLLDKDEKIIKFYSEFNKKHAGNFFTDKRVAKYWIDDRDKTKNHLDFAFYNEIKSIDTICNAGMTYSPYLKITKNNGETFKLCVGGNEKEVKSFFEEVLEKWKKQ